MLNIPKFSKYIGKIMLASIPCGVMPLYAAIMYMGVMTGIIYYHDYIHKVK